VRVLHGRSDARARAVSKSWNRLLPVSYALFAGMLGTQSVLFGKTLSLLIRTSIQGRNQLGTWFFWVVAALLVLTAAFWVSRLNKVHS
jgi:magnesium transporter